MKNKSKILIAQILAGILTFSCVATSCVETNGGYVETGTTIKFDYNDGKSRPYSGRKGSRGCIPDAPGETGLHLEWKQRTPLCSRMATSIFWRPIVPAKPSPS